MPAYGPYETTREIASRHGSIVYSARKAGEPRDHYAVKVFALDALARADADERTELDALAAQFDEDFTRSVEWQRRAAAASPHVAPILDVGREAGSAWYATRLYPRTVQKILEGRVALGKEWVHHLIASIVSGALAFKKTCGRSHGEIKPSNILISASQKAREAAVVLCDPLPGDASEAARYETADLHAVGQIIYQLVRRREVADASDHSILPLQASAEWTAVFGRETDAWLSLCNRLLDPNLSTENYTLERLEADLAKLRPKPPVSGKVLALAAAVAVVSIVGGLVLKASLGRGALTLTSDPPGARIIFAGETLPEPAPVKLQRAKGTYEVRAEYPGLEPRTLTVELAGGRQEQRIVFEYGGLTLESDPPGANVLVGGTNLLVDGAPAVTPLRLRVVKPGTVTYQLSLKDYLSAHGTTDIQSGVVARPPTVTLVKRREGDVPVKFTANPTKGVSVYLTNKLFANPPEDQYLQPGQYQFVARYRQFWDPKEVTVRVLPNQPTNVHFHFERGRLTLESEPSGARVWAGTNLIATTPTNNFLWPLGRVTFRFEKSGFEETNLPVQIVRDQEVIELRPTLISSNGIILLAVEPVPAVVRDAGGAEAARTTPGQLTELTREPGRYPYTIEAPGYQSVTTNIQFISKRRLRMDVRLPVELVPVAFTSDPPGAELFDAETGAAYGTLEEVNTAGLQGRSYKIAARQTRYPTLGWITNEVTVAKGRPNSHVFRFPYTALTLASSPPEARVYEVLESGRLEFIGVTPTNRPYQRPGPIRLRFIRPDGGETNVEETVLRPGPQQVSSRFRPPKPSAYVNSLGMIFEGLPEDADKGGLWVGKCEVTQREYEAIMGAGTIPFKHGKNPPLTNMPADSVTFAQAQEFCRRLTEQDADTLARQGKTGWKYALPTTRQFDQYAELTLTNAVVNRGQGARPDPVHLLTPNELGVAGARGNLWEWCQEGVARGGAYDSSTRGIYAYMLTNLSFALPPNPNQLFAFNVGFRCILVPP